MFDPVMIQDKIYTFESGKIIPSLFHREVITSGKLPDCHNHEMDYRELLFLLG